MTAQYSLFENILQPGVPVYTEQRPQTTPDGEPVRGPVTFLFLDRVQCKHSEGNPVELFKQRLDRVFGKPATYHAGVLWFKFRGRWTFCEVREPSDTTERDRGMFDIYRAVY